MSWGNLPLCDDCWVKREPNRTPYRMVQPELEVCVGCGHETRSGIYVRMEVKP